MSDKQEAVIAFKGENLVQGMMAEFQGQFRALNADLQRTIEKTNRETAGAVDKMRAGWRQTAQGVESVIGLMGRVGNLFSEIGQHALEGAKSLDIGDKFRRSCGDAAVALEQLRTAVDDTIDDTTLQAKANALGVLGLSAEQTAVALSAAYRQAADTGTSTLDVMGKLEGAYKTGRQAALLELGVTLDLKDAYAAAAEVQGRTAADLTEEEKLRIRVTEITRSLTSAYGDGTQALHTHTSALQQASTWWANLKSSMQEWLAGVVIEVVDWVKRLGESTGETATRIDDLHRGLGTAIGTLDAYGGKAEETIQRITRALKIMRSYLPETVASETAAEDARAKASHRMKTGAVVGYRDSWADVEDVPWNESRMALTTDEMEALVRSQKKAKGGRGGGGRGGRGEGAAEQAARLMAESQKEDADIAKRQADIIAETEREADKLRQSLTGAVEDFAGKMRAGLQTAVEIETQAVERVAEAVDTREREFRQGVTAGFGDMIEMFGRFEVVASEKAQAVAQSMAVMVESFSGGNMGKAAAGFGGFVAKTGGLFQQWGGWQWFAEMSRAFEYLGTPGLEWLFPIHLASAGFAAALKAGQSGGGGGTAASGGAAHGVGPGGTKAPSGGGFRSSAADSKWASSDVPKTLIINVNDSTFVDGRGSDRPAAGMRIGGMVVEAHERLGFQLPRAAMRGW